MSYVFAFARFWYDFLIGDKPELFVGPAVGLIVAWLLATSNIAAFTGLVLVAVVIASAAWSVARTTSAQRSADRR
jgi:hypothetical protein